MFITAINLNQDMHRPANYYSSMSGMSRMSGTLRRPSLATPRSPEVPETPSNPADLNAHMVKMIERLTWNVYRIVSVALFANHQLMFSFMLCCYIMKSNYDYSDSDLHNLGQVSPEEWTTFLQGAVLASMMDPADLAEHDGEQRLFHFIGFQEFRGSSLKWPPLKVVLNARSSITRGKINMICKDLLSRMRQFVIMVRLSHYKKVLLYILFQYWIFLRNISMCEI